MGPYLALEFCNEVDRQLARFLACECIHFTQRNNSDYNDLRLASSLNTNFLQPVSYEPALSSTSVAPSQLPLVAANEKSLAAKCFMTRGSKVNSKHLNVQHTGIQVVRGKPTMLETFFALEQS